MKYTILTITLLALFITCNIKAQKVNHDDFIFPLSIEPSVSGSFAELRSNHFHSGIDLSTNGKTGLPVKCMADGIISRIKVSPVGYGNAIYIKHKNGYTTVYGHLNAYAKKIENIITKEQYKIQQFSIDYFPEDSIYVSQGETIGFSGNSGSSGGPHLHYEIRDSKTEEPLNPFFFQSKIKDDVRPKLLTARIYPLDSNSRINGENNAKSYPIVFYDGKFHLKGNPKIYATGHIGIGIEMLDYMSGSWKKCGVYSLKMNVNNTTTYAWNLDRFSFNESRYINSHIDYAYKQYYGKRFQRCYRLPNNQLSIYNHIVNDGIIAMDSIKNIQILAYDAAQNLSELNFTLLKGQSVNIALAPEENHTQILKYDIDNTIKDKSLSCFIPKLTLYDNTEFIVKDEIINNQPIFSIGKKSIPLHKNIRITAIIPDSLLAYKEHLCLASINGNNKKYFAGGTVKNNTIVLDTRNCGKYTFYTDSIKPIIKSVNYYNNKTYTRSSKLIFKISDNFSGINNFKGYFNDTWVLFEYDAKSNTLSCPLNKAPQQCNGEIALKIIVEDQCNNKQTYKGNFILQP
ncbi:M23 family metallopeptidase [Plebeiibacterium sediminum]|uniref:M23 family metallopeptidase n=1 Tax=Plebeiibacterium sediminum TaxID=2992112 RepID=A0AAE3M1P0_9BACT|nr:M23 family metallopeptidase [Plebeiobacterium sediminum]MCW3785217.1 M23 family metallopeptidase [Plebeiobacterium sediminum]